jgi:hypothetical protein
MIEEAACVRWATHCNGVSRFYAIGIPRSVHAMTTGVEDDALLAVQNDNASHKK